MNVLTHLVRLARALDAYPKDKNPEHWKTINGAKVHLDKNGNYDGGAGGRFNGKHHYGQGYKEKQAAKPRRSAEEIVVGASIPNVKGMSEEALRDMMKKENHYGNWNRARTEILRRLKEKEYMIGYDLNFSTADKSKKAELKEKLWQQREAIKRFKEESRIPYRFSKASFENDPDRAETAYNNNNMLNEEVRADYEKWKANKARTASIMKNLANSLKAEPDVKGLSDDALHGRMEKATDYSDWKQALNEIIRRYEEKDGLLEEARHNAYKNSDYVKFDELDQKRRQNKNALEQFRKSYKIPRRFKEESLQEIKKLEAQIKKLDKKAKEYEAKGDKILKENYTGRDWGWRGREKEQAEFYEMRGIQKKLRDEASKLQLKCGEIESKLRKMDEKDEPEEKTFVNGFGEATKRYITTASYERQQRKRDKEIASFIGGNKR